LVAGASIAGPALAYRLRRQGAEVTVVERAPELCPGGQAVDARGVEAVEHEWHRWMRSYWQDRLDSVPTQLTIAEASAMAAKVRELVGPNRQPSSSSRQSAYGAQGLPTGDGLEAGQHE